MTPLPFAEIGIRFALAAGLTTFICVPVALLLLRMTGVPLTYPPLLPQQIIAGTVGGAFLTAFGYWVLSLMIRDGKTLSAIFVWAGVALLVASFYLPYRLTYTTSARFAGVTLAAQLAQGLLHAIVVVVSMICFLRK